MKIDGLTLFVIECSIMIPLTILFIVFSVKDGKRMIREMNERNKNNAAADIPPEA